MKIVPTALAGVVVVETTKHVDPRGAFFRAFCLNELGQILGNRQILQVNVSQTYAAGAVRGMHYQIPPHAEMKFVRCLKGQVWDVAVDLRADSATFLHWHAEPLDAASAKMLVIPEGCAHGFQVIDEDSILLYLHTEFYSPDSEEGVHCDDPRLAIKWPLAITEISERDRQHPFIDHNFKGIRL